MKIFYTEEFKKVFPLLLVNIKKIFKKQEEIFLVYWKDPRRLFFVQSYKKIQSIVQIRR